MSGVEYQNCAARVLEQCRSVYTATINLCCRNIINFIAMFSNKTPQIAINLDYTILEQEQFRYISNLVSASQIAEIPTKESVPATYDRHASSPSKKVNMHHRRKLLFTQLICCPAHQKYFANRFGNKTTVIYIDK